MPDGQLTTGVFFQCPLMPHAERPACPWLEFFPCPMFACSNDGVLFLAYLELFPMFACSSAGVYQPTLSSCQCPLLDRMPDGLSCMSDAMLLLLACRRTAWSTACLPSLNFFRVP
jgi:hypothetical protein